MLAADGDGSQLRLTHRDLPGAEAAEKHRHGWGHYLERLAASGGRRATRAQTNAAEGDRDYEATNRGGDTNGNPTMWFEVAGKDIQG